MKRKQIQFGIIGAGNIAKEFASACARFCHLLTDSPIPVITAICSREEKNRAWFTDNFQSIKISTPNYHDVLASNEVDVVYVALPHNMHELVYIDVMKSGKHLYGEKPFGIDYEANKNINEFARKTKNLIIRSTTHFMYHPGAKMLTEFVESGKLGEITEVKAGFLHSSDLNMDKPVNWKRMAEHNGIYGAMGDLGIHTCILPLRLGITPKSVYAIAQNIVKERKDIEGNMVKTGSFDNVVILCNALYKNTGNVLPLYLETKRLATGYADVWYLEFSGTKGAAKFSTANPRAFYSISVKGKEQNWVMTELGSESYIPMITGVINDFNFSDGFLQMIGAFMHHFRDDKKLPLLDNATIDEIADIHLIMHNAKLSHENNAVVNM